MWSGVDPEVELYASGKVLDDDGEWAGAQSTTALQSPGAVLGAAVQSAFWCFSRNSAPVTPRGLI